MKKTNTIKNLAIKLFPINRSLTGKGNVETLRYIKKKINKKLQIKKVKSNTQCYDWRIPKEWNISIGKLTDEKKNIICDFKRNNLEIMGYSHPIKKTLSFNELKNHLFYIKEKPNVVPYVTSYYKRNWGFCMKYKDFKKLNKSQKYKVNIKSSLKDGQMVYGEFNIKGKSKKTILLTSYICHPSMANNELSGILTICDLISNLKKSYYSIKILLIPETIGAIYILESQKNFLKNKLIAGINLTCTGLNGPYTKISTINENTYIDRIFDRIGKKYNNYRKLSFLKRGSNERQFGCQNLKLPFVSFCRKRFGEYKEYHTSADNLDILNYKEILNSSNFIQKIINEINANKIYLKNKIGEPFLQKYDLIRATATLANMRSRERKIMSDLIAYVDHSVDLKFLSEKFKVNEKKLVKIANELEKLGILKKI